MWCGIVTKCSRASSIRTKLDGDCRSTGNSTILSVLEAPARLDPQALESLESGQLEGQRLFRIVIVFYRSLISTVDVGCIYSPQSIDPCDWWAKTHPTDTADSSKPTAASSIHSLRESVEQSLGSDTLEGGDSKTWEGGNSDTSEGGNTVRRTQVRSSLELLASSALQVLKGKSLGEGN